MKFNSIAQSSLVVLSLLFTAAGAHAQSAARANVPFAFKVGTTQMPAGTYTIQNELGTNLVTVRNVQTGTSVLAMGRQESPSKKTDKLIFHHYGSQYFLTQILGEEGSQGWSSPPPRGEGASDRPGSNNTGNNIEIASK